MDYKHIHENIMKSDPKIRLVTICDLNGKIMHSEHREGVRNLLTPDESKKSLDLAVNAWKTRSDLAPKIGKYPILKTCDDVPVLLLVLLLLLGLLIVRTGLL